MKRLVFILCTMVVAATLFASGGRNAEITGYVLDSACAYTKNLDKPISHDCAIKCAKGGSPLVILTADGTVYLAITDTTPSTGQNERLLPFAGDRVKVTGRIFDRAGSHAIVIEKIEPIRKGK